MSCEISDSPSDPYNDPDTGYETEECLSLFGSTRLQAEDLADTLKSAIKDINRMQQQGDTEPYSDDNSGEVSDPDEDNYPEPDDFY